MMLHVSAILTVGNLRYDSHTAALTLRRGLLPTIDRLDYRLPRGVRFEAAPGDEVSLELDGGEGPTTTFSGTVTSAVRDATGSVVVAHNGAAALARYRPALSLEQLTIQDVVAQLCNDVQVTSEFRISGSVATLARYVALARRTALDEVSRLLGSAGLTAAFTGEGTLVVGDGGSTADRGIRYGRELLAHQVSSGQIEDQRTVVGDGGGAPGTPEGLWPVADFWAGGAADPGPSVRRRPNHELRTTDDAKAAADAWARRATDAANPVRLDCFLVPQIEPGDLLQIQDGPSDIPLPTVRVGHVTHRIDPDRGAATTIHGHDDGAAPGLADIIGGLAGGLL